MHREQLDDHRVRLTDESGLQRIAYVARTASSRWVWLDGRAYELDATPGRQHSHRHAERDALSAPMPATVVAVHVSPGAHVTEGDILISLEAMKMELSIQAPRAGTVRSVACRPGELVRPGVQLLELE